MVLGSRLNLQGPALLLICLLGTALCNGVQAAASDDPVKRLNTATGNGNLAWVQTLVNQGADINAIAADGWTPLCRAARIGDLEVVKWLAGQGADVNAAKNNGGWTALWLAAQAGKLDVVQWLAQQEADINAADNDGRTPLWVAAFNGHLDVVQWLVGQGADINAANNDGCTPLYIAVERGHLDVVQWLAQQGADMNAAKNDGCTPLCIAVEKGMYVVVQCLCYKGASNVNAAMKDGCRPLHLAARSGKLDVVQWLVGQGADINAADTAGRTPLWVAAQKGHPDVVQWLAQQGADINAKTTKEYDNVPICSTAFDVAHGKNHGKVVAYLLFFRFSRQVQRGCLRDLKNEYRRSPYKGELRDLFGRFLCVAAQEGKGDVVEWLIEQEVKEGGTAKAIINTVNSKGKSPLYLATEKGHLSIVRLLFKRGADVHRICGKDQLTAYNIATRNNQSAIARFLLSSCPAVEELTPDGEDVGFNALHRCLFSPPINDSYVRSVVEQNQGYALNRDRLGRLPLHFALKNAASSDLLALVDPAFGQPIHEDQSLKSMIGLPQEFQSEVTHVGQLIGQNKLVPPLLLIDGPSKSGKSLLSRCIAHETGRPLCDPATVIQNHTSLTGIKPKVYFLSDRLCVDDERQYSACFNIVKRELSKYEEPTLFYLGNIDHMVGASVCKGGQIAPNIFTLISLLKHVQDNPRGHVVIATTCSACDLHPQVSCQFEQNVLRIPPYDAAARSRLLAHFLRNEPWVDVSEAEYNVIAKATVGCGPQMMRGIASVPVVRCTGLNFACVNASVLRDAVGKVLNRLFKDDPNRLSEAMMMLRKKKNTVTFKDIDGDIGEIKECRDLIKNLSGKGAFKENFIHRFILLYGPPGTGKTLRARAFSNEIGYNIHEIGCASLVGGSGMGSGVRSVETMFEQACASAPCVLFLDEIDAVGADVTSGAPGASSAADEENRRTVTALFKGVDAFVEQRLGVVVAATNYEDQLDRRLKDRFKKKIRIGVPDEETRLAKIREIFDRALEEFDVEADGDEVTEQIDYLVQVTEGCSIRQIKRIVFNSLKDIVLEKRERITTDMFIAEVQAEKGMLIGSCLENMQRLYPRAIPLYMVSSEGVVGGIAELVLKCSFEMTQRFMDLLKGYLEGKRAEELTMDSIIQRYAAAIGGDAGLEEDVRILS